MENELEEEWEGESRWPPPQKKSKRKSRTTVTLEPEVRKLLDQLNLKKGALSKIINDALKNYLIQFFEELAIEELVKINEKLKKLTETKREQLQTAQQIYNELKSKQKDLTLLEAYIQTLNEAKDKAQRDMITDAFLAALQYKQLRETRDSLLFKLQTKWAKNKKEKAMEENPE